MVEIHLKRVEKQKSKFLKSEKEKVLKKKYQNSIDLTIDSDQI